MTSRNSLRKVIMLGFNVFMAVCFVAGCARAPQAGQPGGLAPAVVSIWHSLQGAEADALQGQVQAITKVHPEVVIKLKYVPEQNFASLSYQAEAGGEGPEIFIASSEINRQLYGQGVLAKAVYADSEAFPAALAGSRFGGLEYALPWLTDVPLLYYRTDTASIPADLTDLFSAKGGISIATLDTAMLSTWWNGQGGRLMDAANPTLDDPNNVLFLKQLLTWQRSRVFRVDPDALTAFVDGKTPYLIAGASQAKLLTQQNVPWGSLTLVNLLGGQGQPLLGSTLGIVNSKIKTNEAMMPVIQTVEKALLTPDVEGALSLAGGRLPANRRYYDRPEAQKGVFPQANLALTKAWALEGSAPEWKLIPLQDKAWSDAIAGSVTSEDALGSAQGEAIKALEIKGQP